jgi:hypothetical protein
MNEMSRLAAPVASPARAAVGSAIDVTTRHVSWAI